MSNADLSRIDQPKSSARAAVALFAVYAAWLVLVFLLGAGEVFVRPRGTPPLALLVAFACPVIAFLVAYRTSFEFREFVLAADLRLITGIQAWRFAGFGFLGLYANGVLPGLFAWPAGLGDIAISLVAPWILLALIRNPGFAASKPFIVWNVLGIVDLVVAVSMGVLGTMIGGDAIAAITPAPMAKLPLVLIPAFLVPVFLILHLVALFQAGHQIESPSARRYHKA